MIEQNSHFDVQKMSNLYDSIHFKNCRTRFILFLAVEIHPNCDISRICDLLQLLGFAIFCDG
jgi:hypothetical protein